MTGTPILAASSQWDSEVFGRRVGILRAGPDVSVDAVRKANKEAFDVVFVKAHEWVDPDGPVDALDHLYDMEIMRGGYTAPRTRPGPPVPSKALLSTGGPRHVEIARTAFRDSRFLRDRRLRERTPEMYARWVSGKPLHVLEGCPDAAFLVASRDDAAARRISLIAVDEAVRGSGVGDALLAGVLLSEPHGLWRVAVSVRNHGALRFYERAGFRVAGVRTAFHVWTEGG